MDRVAVFVDAGYLFAAAGQSLTGGKPSRREVVLDEARFLEFLEMLAERLSGLPLLRIYWYDGSRFAAPENHHMTLAARRNVKLRLGRINQQGMQKGVDSLIVTDMVTLAANKAMADAILISGDEDLLIGVQQAQVHGVRVHLVDIVTHGGMSPLMRQEADSVETFQKNDVQAFFRIVSRQDVQKPIAYDSAAE